MHRHDEKYALLTEYLKSLESTVLAYSGGVDSTFLLSVLSDSPVRSLAVVARSPSMPQEDLQTVLYMVEKFHVPHRIIHTEELEDENFVNNPPDRCFYCKRELFQKLRDISVNEGYKHIIDGSTSDDLSDYRPGLRAKELYHVKSPLMEVGLGKEEIRRLSKEQGIETWDKYSSPCLSSRLPYGEKISLESLKMVGESERILREMGFGELRVRKQGDTARIELSQQDIEKFLDKPVRDTIVSSFKRIGFLYVTLDLEGYQMGKLNRILEPREQIL